MKNVQLTRSQQPGFFYDPVKPLNQKNIQYHNSTLKMKKTTVLIAGLFMVMTASAQVSRTPTPSKQRDSAGAQQGKMAGDKMSKKDMFRELDLTKEQRGKLKEINQSAKAKKEAVNSDEKLDDTQKKQKLREIQRDQMVQVQAILNDEQKAKLKELRRQKQGDNNNMEADN